MKPAFRFACLIALPVALSACDQKDEGGTSNAAGEVLPGSASDAMLPLDTVRSQPPLAPPPASGAPKRGGDEEEAETAASGEPSEAAAGAASEAPAVPTPASKATAPVAD